MANKQNNKKRLLREKGNVYNDRVLLTKKSLHQEKGKCLWCGSIDNKFENVCQK